MLADTMVQGRIEELMDVMIKCALDGDMLALRLCTERAAPPARQRPIAFDLPPLNSAGDAVAALDAIARGVANGELAAAEADVLNKIVNNFRLTLEATVFEERMAELRREFAKSREGADQGGEP
jgi:hypothetical protein